MSQLNKSSTKSSRKIIPTQVNFMLGNPIYIPLFSADKTAKIRAVWELELENGERDSGTVKRNRIAFRELPEGNHTLTLIVGKPLLSQGTTIYKCTISIK